MTERLSSGSSRLDAVLGGGLPTGDASQLGGARYLDESNPPGIQKRDDLVQTVARRVGSDDRECHLVLLDPFPNPFDADHGAPPAEPEPNQPQEPAVYGVVHSYSAPPLFGECTSASAGASSVVSSSRSDMMRSASSGAMPARRRKSSRSRSMMSLSVR